MNEGTLNEQLLAAADEVKLRERQVRTAESYLIQARRRLDEISRKVAHEMGLDRPVSDRGN
jgi:hypothetical protein